MTHCIHIHIVASPPTPMCNSLSSISPQKSPVPYLHPWKQICLHPWKSCPKALLQRKRDPSLRKRATHEPYLCAREREREPIPSSIEINVLTSMEIAPKSPIFNAKESYLSVKGPQKSPISPQKSHQRSPSLCRNASSPRAGGKGPYLSVAQPPKKNLIHTCVHDPQAQALCRKPYTLKPKPYPISASMTRSPEPYTLHPKTLNPIPYLNPCNQSCDVGIYQHTAK